MSRLLSLSFSMCSSKIIPLSWKSIPHQQYVYLVLRPSSILSNYTSTIQQNTRNFHGTLQLVAVKDTSVRPDVLKPDTGKAQRTRQPRFKPARTLSPELVSDVAQEINKEAKHPCPPDASPATKKELKKRKKTLVPPRKGKSKPNEKLIAKPKTRKEKKKAKATKKALKAAKKAAKRRGSGAGAGAAAASDEGMCPSERAESVMPRHTKGGDSCRSWPPRPVVTRIRVCTPQAVCQINKDVCKPKKTVCPGPDGGSRFGNLVKWILMFALKVAIATFFVWLTVDLGVWGDSSDTAALWSLITTGDCGHDAPKLNRGFYKVKSMYNRMIKSVFWALVMVVEYPKTLWKRMTGRGQKDLDADMAK